MIINNLKEFIPLSAKELRKLSDKELAKGLRYFRNDINYDLRKSLPPQSKAKLRRIRDEYIDAISIINAVTYTPRKKHLKAARQYGGFNNKWKKLVISKNEDEKIYFKNGKMRLRGKYTDKARGQFDYVDLYLNPEKEIKRVLKGEKFESVHLQCGKHFLGGHKEPKDYGDNTSTALVPALLKDINYMFNTYNDTEKWLRGVEFVNFKNQKSEKQLNKSRRKSKIGFKVRHAKKKNRRS